MWLQDWPVVETLVNLQKAVAEREMWELFYLEYAMLLNRRIERKIKPFV